MTTSGYSGPYDRLYFVLDEHGHAWRGPTVDEHLAQMFANATGSVVVGIDVMYLYDGRRVAAGSGAPE